MKLARVLGPFGLAAMVLAGIAWTVPGNASPPSQSSAPLDSALVPIVSFEGEEDRRLTVDERLTQLGVPAVSVAVMRDGEIAWARAYGDGADTETLFQFASLSKAVAAAGIIALASEKGVGLDQDISGELPGLDPETFNPDGLPITLRGLLSHTNGTTVSGFPGYAIGQPVPTSRQIIEASGPTNTKPVVVMPNPENERRYSGGGYTVAQYWAEQVSGETFPALMRRLVFDPVGMTRSTFATGPAQDFPDNNVARGYLRSGDMIDGGWRLHPEHAAASLWGTPREYLLFVRALMLAMEGDSTAGIAPEVALEMTKPVASRYGLGIGVAEVNGAIRLNHSGSNVGYKSNFMAYPAGKNAVVSVVNSESGWPMVGDIGRTANVVYGWPTTPLLRRTRLAATVQDFSNFTGDYAEADTANSAGDVAFTLLADGTEMAGKAPSGYTFRLVKTGEATFIDPQDGQEGTFTADAQGVVSVTFGETTYVQVSRSD